MKFKSVKMWKKKCKFEILQLCCMQTLTHMIKSSVFWRATQFCLIKPQICCTSNSGGEANNLCQSQCSNSQEKTDYVLLMRSPPSLLEEVSRKVAYRSKQN